MIRNRKNQMQFISYDSLSITRDYISDETGHGLYHPADIDGVLQFDAKTHPMNAKYNQAMLVYEFKRRNATMQTGQRILLESLCNAIQKSGGYSLVAIVRHSVDNPKIDVDGGRGIVTEYFYDGAWRSCKPMTAIAFTNLFMIGAGIKKDKGVE